MTRLAIFVSTFGYLGLFPIAPGTFGSAAGLALYGLVRLFQSPLVEAGTIAALFAAGVWSGSHAERYFGGADPGPAVIDEVMGMLITLFLIPVSLWGALAGFALFRALDVIKPYPASRLERLRGGLGVMADDAMAAIYANLALRAVAWVAPSLVR